MNPETSATARLGDEAVLAVLEAERLLLCDRLDRLNAASWSVPSLCPRWTVRGVVAHLTLSTRESASVFVRGMLRYRGNFDRMTAERARQRAEEYSPVELVAQLRDHAGSSGTAFGSSLRDCLIDVIVHGQDIARPLDLDRPTTPERTVIALDHALQSRW